MSEEPTKPITSKAQLSSLTERVNNSENGIEEIKQNLVKLEESLKGNGLAAQLALIEKQLEILRQQNEKPKPFPPGMKDKLQSAKNEQAELMKILISLDEHNFGKARNPTIFGMVNIWMLGPYASGNYHSVDKMLSPILQDPYHTSEANLYAVASFGFKGGSREEFKEGMTPVGLNTEMLQFRMNEKNKLREGNRK